MKKNLTVALAALVVLATSCGNFLDVKPKGKVIPETDEEYMAVLNNMLYNIETCESGYENVIFPGPAEIVNFEAVTDNLDANLEDILEDAKSGLPLYAGTQINRRQSYWTYLFQRVRDCNIILEAMESRGSDLSRELSAACLAIKGICYYNLLRSFCDPYSPVTAGSLPGLPLVERFDIEQIPQRSNLKESADYVVSLLEASAAFHISDDKFIFTEDICKAFLAKTCFWIQEWDRAADLCRELLAKYPLTKREAYVSLIQDPSRTGGEILARSFSKGSPASLYYTDARKAAGRRPINKTFIDLFAADGTSDIRYATFVGARRMNTKILGYRLRASELCLTFAECLAHMGKEQEALDQLNRLRSVRIENAVPYTASSLPAVGKRLIIQDATGKALTPLMGSIFDERRKELFLEGDRWYELKRNGRPEMTVISNARKYTTKAYLYTFPINRKDVDLGGLKQNEGYVH